jgi:predicted O-methyltransferase YrrM
MERAALVVIVAVVAVGVVATLSAYSEEASKKPDAAFREKFIKEFQHIGLDSTPGDAMFLRVLVASAKCTRAVEVGTCRGFGAMNMGIALERNGGRLWTYEIDADMVKKARENLKTMGLDDVVTVIEGDALKTLGDIEGPVDFVFLDALKGDYFKYFKLLEPKLKVGAIIVGDNAVKSARAMKDFLDFLEESPDYESVIIRASMEKGDGMVVACKIR